MRKLYFLVPGTTGKFGGGGLWAELNTCKLAQQVCEAEIVTYRQREPERAFLADILPNSDREAWAHPKGLAPNVLKDTAPRHEVSPLGLAQSLYLKTSWFIADT